MKIAVLGHGVTAKAVEKVLARLNGYQQVAFEEAECVIASPGIDPKTFPKVTVPIISEVEFAWRLFNRPESTFRPKLIGITGTNGKTTVTSLIAHLLDIPTAGNIGTPLIEYVDSDLDVSALSVELSSFQLELCSEFRPHIAVLLNLTPDHVDRHPTMPEYAAAKAKLFQCQTADDFLIYFDQDAWLTQMTVPAKAQKQPFNLSTLPSLGITETPIPGDHNKLNIAAGVLAAKDFGLSIEKIKQKLVSFKAPEHRIEPVSNTVNRQIYNDSKATNPESTLVAVRSFESPLLILCGKDKGLELGEFLKEVHSKAKAIVVFGELAIRLEQEAKKLAIKLHVTHTLEAALQKSLELTGDKDVILFSPSSSSFDMYDNYEHRGRVFKEVVCNLVKK